jgi:acetoacetyl-CoA synthetase
MKAGIRPLDTHNLSRLRGIGSTGSPLSAEAFEWTYRNVKADDLWLASISGGTDVCTALVGGCPVLPVTAGELQCRCLGAKVAAYNEAGESVIGEMGELVITEPMPSMPVYLWGDRENRRYRESYFETFPGIWRHGDWIRITERGTCIIYGRSDATIKRHGVRLGTSEIYRYVEKLPFVHESLAIDLTVDRGPRLLLFVVMNGDAVLDDTKRDAIRETIRRDVSPRFVPDEISAIREIPKTINGKKMEVPVKRILMGMAPEKAANLDSMGNPGAFQFFLEYRDKLKGHTNA